MSEEYYSALKKGRWKYQEAILKGQYPYLPDLDNVLSYADIASTVNIGTIDIPLEKLVGTKTAERSHSFAANFMPLLGEKTEFAGKWDNVYNYQISDGIQDPISAYEFMGRFYVQEGNKRVSVLKYLGAYSILGNVTRLVPRRSDELENRLYYEFLDFYKTSRIYDVWFQREGGYKKLLSLMGKEPDVEWDDEERLFFRSAYGRFAKAFHMAHGEKLDLGEADAFLVYVEIFGYDTVKGQTEKEMYGELRKIWDEIRLAERGNRIELVQNPSGDDGRRLTLRSLFFQDSQVPEGLKIGFVYAKAAETSSWAYAHELGRLHLQQAFDGKITTAVYDKAESDEAAEAAIEQAIEEKCTVIFTTSARMIEASVRCAVRHPEVKIYNCSVKMSYSSICTYYARMYEAKFLMGAIAAAMSHSDKLGYLADCPVYGTIADINAFALGARMINPDVTVCLEWSGKKDANPRERFKNEGITFISGNDIINPAHASREYGLYAKNEDGSLKNIGTPILHWGKFYEQIVKNAFRPTEEDALRGKKAVNYWWGMSADVIDVICSDNIPHGTHRLIEFLKNSIRADSFHPFDGLIYSQNGVVRCKDGEGLEAKDIIDMDWLAENVDGRIPDFEELTEEAKSLVEHQGIQINEKGIRGEVTE